jgi:hypothetical protein
MWWGKLFSRWLVGAHRTDRRALQSIAFWVCCHSEMLTCAQVKEGIKKVRYVLSNAHDASEIRRRQTGAIKKRDTVKHNGERVQTVRVHCVSNRDHTKTKTSQGKELRNASEIKPNASNSQCEAALIGPRRTQGTNQSVASHTLTNEEIEKAHCSISPPSAPQ